MVARILEHKLRREGHDVHSARSAEEVGALCAHLEVDVVLLSAALFARGITTPRPRAGWFLLAGTFDAESLVHDAMAAGAAGIVRLPFKPTEVAAQVATLLALVPS